RASARPAFLRRGVRRPARAALGMPRLCQVRRAGARHRHWRSAANRTSFAAMPRLAAAFLAVLAVGSAAASGCATSTNTVKAAKDARYNVSFNTVWQVVQEEVHRRYPAIHREDQV